MFNIDELNNIKELEKSKKQIHKCLRDYYSGKHPDYSKEYVEELKKEFFQIDNKIIFLTPPVKSNGIIDLKTRDYKTFDIFLNNSINCVGYLQYRGHHVGKFLGDIGYSINEQYRGNNYAYQALCLISEYLEDNNIKDFWISTHCSNIPSLKTIEKYMENHNVKKIDGEEEDIYLFECDTKIKKEKIL